MLTLGKNKATSLSLLRFIFPVKQALGIKMYLSDEFFNWSYGDFESTGVDYENLTRGHDMWRHAQNKIKDDPNEFDRVDCISSLKRAVNSRLKTIDSVYSLNKLPSLRSKKQILEKYQDYGVIRPSILKDLFDVRNLLEHEDAEPPEIDKCHYYVDMVWYFLKSTDSLLHMKCDCLNYQDNGSDLFIGPDVDWGLSFNGTVNRHLVSETEKPNYIEIIDVKTNGDKHDLELIEISGAFKMTEALKTKFARDYFGAVGYWYEDHA